MIIQIKNSGNTGNAPVSLANGELALNYADQLLYYKHSNGSIVVLANGASLGAASNDVVARQEANAAFAQANAAYDQANAAYNTANTAGIIALGAFSQANAAYTEANTAYAEAQAAFNKANGAVQTGFPTINVAGQNNIVATTNNDTLILAAGESIGITTDAPNNIITLSVTAINGGTF